MIHQELDNGILEIDDSVMLQLIKKTLKEVPGVVTLEGVMALTVDRLRKGKQIDVITGESNSVSIKIKVMYGYRVKEVVQLLQQKVIDEMREWTDIVFDKINVTVTDLVFEETTTSEKEIED